MAIPIAKFSFGSARHITLCKSVTTQVCAKKNSTQYESVLVCMVEKSQTTYIQTRDIDDFGSYHVIYNRGRTIKFIVNTKSLSYDNGSYITIFDKVPLDTTYNPDCSPDEIKMTSPSV